MLPQLVAALSTFKPWAKSAVQAAPRMICCYVPNDVNILEWIPKDAGDKYSLSPTLETLKDHRDDFTVLTGLGHPNCNDGHSRAETWLTAANLKAKSGSDYTNSVCVDQRAAELHGKKTRFPSLQLSDLSGTGGAGHSHTLSFDINGTPLPAGNNPRRLFEGLFVPDTAGDRKAAHQRCAERRSNLDDLAEESAPLNQKLGPKDKQKLDEYFTSVRQTRSRWSGCKAGLMCPSRR